MLPIVGALLSEGLNLLGNAVLAKGKEFVEEKTGLKLEPNMSEETVLKLKQYELENEIELQKLQLENNKLDLEVLKVATEAQNIETQEITKRWSADMASDSWLSKNVRPMTLIYILSVYTLMAFSDGLGLHITNSYVELLGQWGMLIMSAYFGGRTIEKVIELKGKQ